VWISNVGSSLPSTKTFEEEVVVDIVPLDMCGVILGSLYLYVRDAIFRRRENPYQLVKDGKAFTINAHKDTTKISLINPHQVGDW